MTAARFEDLVALVLEEAHGQSEQCALMALEEPVQATPLRWTPRRCPPPTPTRYPVTPCLVSCPSVAHPPSPPSTAPI